MIDDYDDVSVGVDGGQRLLPTAGDFFAVFHVVAILAEAPSLFIVRCLLLVLSFRCCLCCGTVIDGRIASLVASQRR